MSPHNLVAQSKLSSATRVMSLTMPPPGYSLPPILWFCGCHAHTPLHKMIKSSTLSVPLIIWHALCFFRLLFKSVTRLKHSAPPHTYWTASPPKQTVHPTNLSPSMVSLPHMSICTCFVAPAIPTSPPQPLLNWLPNPLGVSSKDTPLITMATTVLISQQTASLSLNMFHLMSQISHSLSHPIKLMILIFFYRMTPLTCYVH
jgi:hypothetical protein